MEFGLLSENELDQVDFSLPQDPVFNQQVLDGKRATNPKMHQGITHKGKFGTKPFIVNEFLRGILAFEKHLGPVFIQFNDRFVLKRKEELFRFLQSLPIDIPFFLELRHKDWFGKGDIREELFTTRRILNIGAVITDTAGRRDCVHMYLPVPKIFIRFAGNNLHPTDYARIDAWVERIGIWIKKGLKEVFFFMHMHDEVNSPEMISYMIDKINKIPGVNLPKPQFIGKNES